MAEAFIWHLGKTTRRRDDLATRRLDDRRRRYWFLAHSLKLIRRCLAGREMRISGETRSDRLGEDVWEHRQVQDQAAYEVRGMMSLAAARWCAKACEK